MNKNVIIINKEKKNATKWDVFSSSMTVLKKEEKKYKNKTYKCHSISVNHFMISPFYNNDIHMCFSMCECMFVCLQVFLFMCLQVFVSVCVCSWYTSIAYKCGRFLACEKTYNFITTCHNTQVVAVLSFLYH